MSRKRLSSTYECLWLYDQYGKGRNEGVQIYLLVLAKWQTQLMFGQNKGQDDGHFINQEMHRRDSSWMLLLLCVQPAMQEGTFNQNSHMPQCSSRADARQQMFNRLHFFHTSPLQHRADFRNCPKVSARDTALNVTDVQSRKHQALQCQQLNSSIVHKCPLSFSLLCWSLKNNPSPKYLVPRRLLELPVHPHVNYRSDAARANATYGWSTFFVRFWFFILNNA